MNGVALELLLMMKFIMSDWIEYVLLRLIYKLFEKEKKKRASEKS